MTKEQLARWRNLGFAFDDFYNTVAKDEVVEVKIINVSFLKVEQDTKAFQKFLVKILLSADPYTSKVNVQLDDRQFTAYQKFDRIENLNVVFADVFVDFYVAGKLEENFKLTVNVVDIINSKTTDTKTINVKVDSDGGAGETGDEDNGVDTISLVDFITIFGNKKLFINNNMKDYKEVYNTDVKLFVVKLNEYLKRFVINTPLRLSHFFGQIEHESVKLSTTTEFHDGSNYEDRDDIGNINKGDGRRFRGRGLIQLTGRDNYESFRDFYNLNKSTILDFAVEPNNLLLASNLDIAIQVSCWFWQIFKGLNQFADEDDLIYITYIVNGGFNGYIDRKKKTKKSIEILNAVLGEDIDKIIGEYELASSRLYNSFDGTYMWAKYHDKYYAKLEGTEKNDKLAKTAYTRIVYLYDNNKVKKTKNNLKKYNNAKIRLSSI